MRKILAVASIFALLGCSFTPSKKPVESPAVTVSQAGDVKTTGDAQVPAKVDTKKTSGNLAIPEGSRIEFNAKLDTVSVQLAKATNFVSESTQTAVTGPTAFVPEKGPTAQELSDAKAGFWTKLMLQVGIFVGGSAAIFGLVKEYNMVMYGGLAVLGASLFGLFIERHPILFAIAGIGIAMAYVGPYLWHKKIKPAEAPK
jgi:hypothetical protein